MRPPRQLARRACFLAALALSSPALAGPVLGDADGDADIDLADLSMFMNCFSGAAPSASPSCDVFDFSPGDPIGASDFESFACGWSGPGATVDAVSVEPQPSPVADVNVVLNGSSAGAVLVRISGGVTPVTVGVGNCSFVAPVQLRPNAVNRLFVTGIFGDGVPSAPVAVTITHDTQAPALFVDLPAEGASITTATADVAGRVSDALSGFTNMLVKVAVNGGPFVPAALDIGVGANGTFFLSQVPLDVGGNTIEVTAIDGLGNGVRESVSVTHIAVPPGTPEMTVFSGNGQSAPIHEILAQPIEVRVTGAKGLPLAGKLIAFAVTRSDGRLGASPAGLLPGATSFQTFTDSQGIARAFWRLGSDAGRGNNRVEVTSDSVVGTTLFCASATAAPPRQINIGSGNNQRAEVGAPAAEPLDAWVNDSCNPVAGVEVTFSIRQGNGKINGLDEAAMTTDAGGHVSVGFTLGTTPGNNVIEATFPGNANPPAVFTIVGVERDAGKPTRFSGIVLDNTGQPIQNATCALIVNGTTLPFVHSELDGQFRFDDIPLAGPADVHVAGASATHVGGVDGVDVPLNSFPSLRYSTVIVPNAANSLPTPVLLPKADPANARFYSTTQDAELTIVGMAGLKMVVKAGSMRIRSGGQFVPAPNGTPISLNQVHHDDVPMPLPDGAAPPFAWTLQPGGAMFDPPITVFYPNMSGLPAGAIANFLSFNHDTGKFEIIASGHVTTDGTTIVTDPGAGISVAGWGCNCPPYSVTGSCHHCSESQAAGSGPNCCIPACTECQICDDGNCFRRAIGTPCSGGCGSCTLFGCQEFEDGTGCGTCAGCVSGVCIPNGYQCFFAGCCDFDEVCCFLDGPGPVCMNPGAVCCGDGTFCLAEQPLCCNGRCCDADATCCDDGCASAGAVCCGPGLGACPAAAPVCCGDHCCNTGEVCCEGECHPANSVCCPDGRVCPGSAPVCCGDDLCLPEGVTCCPDGSVCPPSDPVCCGGDCHPDGTICCPGGSLVCDAEHPLCCNNRCCASDQICCNDGCYDPGHVCCPFGGACAVSNPVCCSPNCCCTAAHRPVAAVGRPVRVCQWVNLVHDEEVATMRHSWATWAILMLVAASRTDRANAQQLDDSCTMTANGQTVQVNPDGSFELPNIAAADLFGAGGPGTPPDFLSDDFLRLTGVCTGSGSPVYVSSECFRIRRGESFQVGQLTFSDTSVQGIVSLRAAPEAPTLTTIGQQTPVNLIGIFADGSSGPLNAGAHCSASFRTSNPAVASVTPDAGNPPHAVVTARSTGTAMITASVEGATSVTSITVSLGDSLTTVTGIVQSEAGDPIDGAMVRFVANGAPVGGTGVTGGPGHAPGQFIVSGVASQLGPISVYAEGSVDAVLRTGVGLRKTAVPGGFTDAGLVTLDDRMVWIANANGLWQTGSNWISGAPPTANQIAVIDAPLPITVTHSAGTSVIKGLQCAETLVLAGGALTINGDSAVDGPVTLSGATLGGSGTVTFAGPLSWTGGTMSGTGRTVIAPTGSLTMSGSGSKSLFRILENHSPNATWTGGQFLFGGGTLSNESDGIFTAALTADLGFLGQFGTNLFRNAGTFIQAGPGTMTNFVPFNNTGTINVPAGTLLIRNTGVNSGSIEVGVDATLNFLVSTYTHDAFSAVTNHGILGLGGTNSFAGALTSDGTLNLTGTANLNADHTLAGTVNLTGTLGGSGITTIAGPLSWTGGTMSGTGRTVIAPTGSLNISGAGGKSLFRVLENHSPHATWTGGQIGFGGGTLSNESDGIFTAALTADLGFLGQFGTNLFRNAGTFIQAGAGTMTNFVPFNNTGTINVPAGTLLIRNTGVNSGSIEVGVDATLNFLVSTYTHDAFSAVTNHGILGFGGTNSFAGALTSDGTLNLTGTVNLNADHTLASTVNLTGTLGGSGITTIAGPLSWTGGTMSGTGRTVIAPTGSLSISGASSKSLNRVLENHSPNATWTGGHILFGGGTLSNESNGVFTAALTTALSFLNSFGTNVVHNAGSFIQVGPGTMTNTVTFDNTGEVSVQAGTLQLSGSFTETDGSTVLAGGSITKSGGVMQINGGTIGLGADTAAGAITGSVTLGNVAATTVPRPHAAGTLNITGAHTQTAGTLDMELGGTVAGTEFDQLVVSGTATLGGRLRLSLINGFVPSAGQQFQVLTAGTRTGTFSDVALVNFPANLGAGVSYSTTDVTVTITSK